MFDSNNDGRTLIISRHGTVNPIGLATGNVDIIADVRDQMNNLNYKGASAPQSVGYYIRPLFANTHGEKRCDRPLSC
jgi:hypothetical protein